jgi:transcriptional regulator with GAF, ATPase, and Fis domain
VAKSEYSVLLLGPSGSGKDVIAKKMHECSVRANGPFMSVNCSALTETLVESELFGHKRGAFTGATHDRAGAFEAARGGTLFLDEIGDLPISLQPKLLRALENREIRPLGSDRNIETNVRIIAADDCFIPLGKAAAAGLPSRDDIVVGALKLLNKV